VLKTPAIKSSISIPQQQVVKVQQRLKHYNDHRIAWQCKSSVAICVASLRSAPVLASVVAKIALLAFASPTFRLIVALISESNTCFSSGTTLEITLIAKFLFLSIRAFALLRLEKKYDPKR